jgi:hypothetical protein
MLAPGKVMKAMSAKENDLKPSLRPVNCVPRSS